MMIENCFERDLDAAFIIGNEYAALDALTHKVYEVATTVTNIMLLLKGDVEKPARLPLCNELLAKVWEEEKIGNEYAAPDALTHKVDEFARTITKIMLLLECDNNKTVPLHLCNAFLAKVWDANKEEILAAHAIVAPVQMSQESINRLNAFIMTADPSFLSINNPFTIEGEKEIANRIQDLYRVHSKLFIEIPVPLDFKKLSCFDYAIEKKGFKRAELVDFMQKLMNVEKRDATLEDYVGFLKKKGMIPRKPPFRRGDILVYRDRNNVVCHAAFVDGAPGFVYAKFGNRIPFAYHYNEKYTHRKYGVKWQIFR